MVKKNEMLQEVKLLEKQVEEMEQEIELMQGDMQLDSVSSACTSIVDVNEYMDDEQKSGMLTPVSLLSSSPKTKKSQVIAQSNGLCATVVPQGCSWSLTVTKENIRMETTITKHAELLDNLQHMCASLGYQYRVPSTFYSHTNRSVLVSVVNLVMTKKYNKVHCRSVAKTVQIFIATTPDNANAVVKAKTSLGTTTMQLLQAYLRCQHYKQLAIHARAFFRLFIEESPIEVSPAVMALCAMICSLRCKHIANVLPMDSLLEHGQYYFDRAHELVEDKFDEADIETFASYTFMAIYKLTLSQVEEGVRYGDMAERISYLLKSRYDDDASSGDAILFHRLVQFLHRVRTYEEVSMDRKKYCCSDNSTLRYCTLVNYDEGHWKIAEDESDREKLFVRMHQYILQLQREAHQASRSLQSCNLFYLAQLIAYQVELAARHWYVHTLPQGFKLSLSLFDTDISEEVFESTLDSECAQSAIPVLTTLAVYDEYMVVGQSYIPKHVQTSSESHKTGGCCSKQKQERRCLKLLDIRREIEFDGSDEEYLEQVSSLVKASAQTAQLNSPVIHQSVQAALCTVRLLRYLRSRSKDCYFEMRVLMNAWQVLSRVLRLGSSLPLELKAMLPLIRTNLVFCLNMVRDEFRLMPHQGKPSTLVMTMEQEIQGQVVPQGMAGPF
ncbi:hypothetical protein DFQ28_004429 [Apophysomyces sp. BC1034]|nr:hypothetical protein DFQ30_001120 [Apophysomyces sp. BC1015]KAG0180729.1 hypothetical protein DFQ29_010234 [Apophysomyces sp. BC1021]KAG0188730.1 hypothetical protein DFQ28_004429 [Apophysomyces sp. BC1034]